MKPYVFHREADEEFLEALRYYARISPELGGRFYDEMEKLLGDVRKAPLRYRVIRQPVRRHLSEIFPFALFYVDRPDDVWILAVAHFRRRPFYWMHRLG